MTSDAVKLARLQAKAEKERFRRELTMKMVTNPAALAIGGCVIVELLQHVSIAKIPATPGGFDWNIGPSFGFHGGKPPQDVRLLSDALGSAIEVGLIINLAGGFDQITNALKTGLQLPVVAGLLAAPK